MKRLGFTIILNGEKHLLHNHYAEYLLKEVLDFWVIVEGASDTNGSTSWCKGDNSDYHLNSHSIDNTIGILETLQKNYSDKLKVIYNNNKLWQSEDAMNNAAIAELKQRFSEGLLWQIDIDEQWTKEDILINENFFLKAGAKTGAVKFFQYVGKDIIAIGEKWGDNPIQRLWDWKGEFFITHDPPILQGNNEPTILLPKRFHHYSYYYEEDVKFKSIWYNYGEKFFKRWKELQEIKEFPISLTQLFPQYEGIIDKIKEHNGLEAKAIQKKLALNRITIIAIDCVNLERVIFAMQESLKYCEFNSAKILTSLIKKDYEENGINFIKIPKLENKEAYSNFIIRYLNLYFSTDFVLVIQWDGFILNPSAWTDLFYRYDYIAALWDKNDSQGNYPVGNGGFSLRSKRLCEFLWTTTQGTQINTHPEDLYISNIAKKFFKISPPAIANLFSTENTYGGSFGFHNINRTCFNFWNKYHRRKHENITAVHSGDMGDIIYCIPTLRYLKVNTLILNIRTPTDYNTGFTEQKATVLKPLLENEGFEVKIQVGYNPLEVNYIMDKWRLNSDLNNTPLALSQAMYFDAKIDYYKTFLKVNSVNFQADIVISKTERYNNPIFDWNYILDGLDDSSIAFLGLKHEYAKFMELVANPHIRFIETENLLQAAEILAASKLYIGNPSSIMAIAEGLKIRRIYANYPPCKGCTLPYDLEGKATFILTNDDLIAAKHILSQWLNK